MDLTEKKCVPCEGEAEPMHEEEAQQMLEKVEGWKLQYGHLVREFTFKDFKEAMVFVNKVADLAEEEGHHPDINISWNKVRLEVWTHAIDGLSENDFILAAKVKEI